MSGETNNALDSFEFIVEGVAHVSKTGGGLSQVEMFSLKVIKKAIQ